MSIVHMTGPVVSIEMMNLVVLNLDERRVKITREIFWVREIIATVLIRHGKNTVKTYSESVLLDRAYDFSMTCCADFDVTMKSTMRVVIHAVVQDVPVLRLLRRYSMPPDCHLSIPSEGLGGWLIDDEDAIDRWLATTPRPTIDQLPILGPRIQTEGIVWSSQMSPAMNALTMNQIRKRLDVPSVLT